MLPVDTYGYFMRSLTIDSFKFSCAFKFNVELQLYQLHLISVFSKLYNYIVRFQLWRLWCEAMYDNLNMMKMQLEGDRCCMLISGCTCTISVNITVHFKRLQEYTQSIIKDKKSLLKIKRISQKNHQDSECCI